MRLNAAEQRLIRLCRLIGYGAIQGVAVRGGVPTHLVGERPIECRIDATKSASLHASPFPIQDEPTEIALHEAEQHLITMVRAIESGTLQITVRDGLPVFWHYYPDYPSRTPLNQQEVDTLRLRP